MNIRIFTGVFCAITVFPSSVLAQTLPQIINKSFYKFPPAVERAKEQSLVAVEVIVPRLINNAIGTSTMQSTGFVINNSGSVITTMHSFGDVPSEGFHKATSVRIHDGSGFFEAELYQKYDWIADLVLIQVKNWADVKGKFRKTAITIAEVGDKKNLETFDRLYVFRMAVSRDSIYDSPLILGPYLMETNVVVGGDEPEHTALGLVNGQTDNGFSGSPLLGPDGHVYGVVQRTSSIHTYVVTLDELASFIKSDAKTLEKKMTEAQEKK